MELTQSQARLCPPKLFHVTLEVESLERWRPVALDDEETEPDGQKRLSLYQTHRHVGTDMSIRTCRISLPRVQPQPCIAPEIDEWMAALIDVYSAKPRIREKDHLIRHHRHTTLSRSATRRLFFPGPKNRWAQKFITGKW
jgi:hypothetical protein